MKCPKCGMEHIIKTGIIKLRQRYKCKECNFNFTVELKSTAKSHETKRQALELYLEGLGFRAIGRFLKTSHVSVYKWIKSFGEKVDNLKSDNEIKIVEMDELHSYIGQKKDTAGYGLLLIEMGKDSSHLFWVPGEQKQE